MDCCFLAMPLHHFSSVWIWRVRTKSLMMVLIRTLIQSDRAPSLQPHLITSFKSSSSQYSQTRNLGFNIWILGTHKLLVHNISLIRFSPLQGLLRCWFLLWLWTVIFHRSWRVGTEVVGIRKVTMQQSYLLAPWCSCFSSILPWFL